MVLIDVRRSATGERKYAHRESFRGYSRGERGHGGGEPVRGGEAPRRRRRGGRRGDRGRDRVGGPRRRLRGETRGDPFPASLPGALFPPGPRGAALSAFEFDRYKAEKGPWVARFLFVERDPKAFPAVRAGVSRGARVGEAINWGRALVATPPAELRPRGPARAARGVGRGIGAAAAARVRVRVLGLPELAALKAGGILAVAKGSPAPPRLIVAEYRGGSPGAPWTALVGKGVTFDTGGISLKKWEGMEKMKYDMAGGAAMLATIRAAAALGIRRNLVAVVPSVENMPSGTAYRPGDVLRLMSGKTVEILSTDAEGRLLLADAMTYAVRQYKPGERVDAATLTGACIG